MTLAVVAAAFALLLVRRIDIVWIALGAALLFNLAGIASPADSLARYVNWDVLAIYWGYGLLALSLRDSGLPAWVANRVLVRLHRERDVVLFLCVFAMFLSSFMANPVVVIMLAPLAIELARRFGSPLFPYLVLLAVSSNMVTTVTMIADPPALIMASATGLNFLDFYWFRGALSLGTLSVIGLAVSSGVLAWQLRHFRRRHEVAAQPVPVRLFPLWLFIASIAALALLPWHRLGAWNHPGLTGLALGVIVLLGARARAGSFLREFDWKTLVFLVGIFIMVASVEQVGLLADFAGWLGRSGLASPTVYLAVFVWGSVLLSSFIDNVPYTVLMLPVCAGVAELLGVSPFPFYFGMLIGTGIGGNLTPVGATANVLACGIAEKHGERIEVRKYFRLAWPFSLAAVAVVHVLLQWLWL